MDIKQFKLANGEEIVCEVVEWHDEDTSDIIIRDSYRIIPYASPASSADRYYTFAPWMLYQEGEGLFQSINSNLIVGSCSPTEEMLKNYWKIKEAAKGKEDLTEEDLESKMEDYMENLRQMLSDYIEQGQETTRYDFLDSDGKVISFPKSDKSKLH